MNRIGPNDQAQLAQRLPATQPKRTDCEHTVNTIAQLVFVILRTIVLEAQLIHFLSINDNYYSGHKDIPQNQEDGHYDFTYTFPIITLCALTALSSVINRGCERRTKRSVSLAMFPIGAWIGSTIGAGGIRYYLQQADGFNRFVSEYDQHPERFACLETISHNIHLFFDPSQCRLDANKEGICYEETSNFVGCLRELDETPIINTSFNTTLCNDWTNVSEKFKAVWSPLGMVTPMHMDSTDVPLTSNLNLALKCVQMSMHYSRVQFFKDHLCTARTLNIDPIISKCATKQFFAFYNHYLKNLEENHLADKRAPKLFMTWVTQSCDKEVRELFFRTMKLIFVGTMFIRDAI